MLEHRFFGESNPYDDLSVQSFRVHNVQQAVADLAYFAQNVQLPMPGGDAVQPGKAPYVFRAQGIVDDEEQALPLFNVPQMRVHVPLPFAADEYAILRKKKERPD